MSFVPPPHRTELLWYLIDFDGTVCASSWTPEIPTYTAEKPFPDVYRKLWELRSAGKKIVIHSSRPWSDFEYVEKYMEHYGLPFDRIVLGKCLGYAYIDDRNRLVDSESWL